MNHAEDIYWLICMRERKECLGKLVSFGSDIIIISGWKV